MSASSRDDFARASLWSPSDCSWRKCWSLPLAFPVSDGCSSNDHSFYFGTESRFLVGSSFEDSWKEWTENLSNKSRTRAVCSFEETRDCRSLSEELVREGLLLLAKSENILLLQSWQCLETNMIWGAFFLTSTFFRNENSSQYAEFYIRFKNLRRVLHHMFVKFVKFHFSSLSSIISIQHVVVMNVMLFVWWKPNFFVTKRRNAWWSGTEVVQLHYLLIKGQPRSLCVRTWLHALSSNVQPRCFRQDTQQFERPSFWSRRGFRKGKFSTQPVCCSGPEEVFAEAVENTTQYFVIDGLVSLRGWYV